MYSTVLLCGKKDRICITILSYLPIRSRKHAEGEGEEGGRDYGRCGGNIRSPLLIKSHRTRMRLSFGLYEE